MASYNNQTSFNKVNFIPRSFHYSVTIDGFPNLTFTEASGLQAELTTEDVIVGGRNNNVYKLPLRVKHSNLVLKRAFNTKIIAGAVSQNNELYTTWLNDILHKEGNFDTPIKLKNISVILEDPQGEKLMSWDIVGAYPVKWLISNYNAKENTVAIETIEFVYQSAKMNF